MKKTLTRTILRVGVLSSNLPDRTSDIRFFVYDECDSVAKATGRRAMHQNLVPEITERTEATVTLTAVCWFLDPSGIPPARIEDVLRSSFLPSGDRVEIEIDC